MQVFLLYFLNKGQKVMVANKQFLRNDCKTMIFNALGKIN